MADGHAHAGERPLLPVGIEPQRQRSAGAECRAEQVVGCGSGTKTDAGLLHQNGTRPRPGAKEQRGAPYSAAQTTKSRRGYAAAQSQRSGR
jgi:hypothetical protein